MIVISMCLRWQHQGAYVLPGYLSLASIYPQIIGSSNFFGNQTGEKYRFYVVLDRGGGRELA